MADDTPKIQVQPIIIAILSAALGAIATWSLKLEDRIYQIAVTRVTQSQLHESESRINKANAELKTSIARLIDELRALEKQPCNRTRL